MAPWMIGHSRQGRRRIALLAMLALLFAQFATFAHACPTASTAARPALANAGAPGVAEAGVPEADTDAAHTAGAHMAAVDGAGTDGSIAAMPGCDGDMAPAQLDPAYRLLCKASCERSDQNSPPAAKAIGVDLPVLALCFALVPATFTQPASLSAAPDAPGRSSPGWPPLYLLHLSLRN